MANTFKMVSQLPGRKVLDVPGFSTADGTLIQLFHDNGGANQHWQLVPAIVKIVSLSSGLVLDVTGASTADGTLIQQFPDNGGANQQWQLVAVENGLFKIVSQLPESKVLDVPGFAAGVSAIQLFHDNGGKNQHWRLDAVEGDADTFKIVSQSSGKVLTVPGDAPLPAPIEQQDDIPGATDQHWRLVPVADTFKIVSQSSGLVLDVPGFATGSTPIQQFHDKGGDNSANQHWQVIPLGNDLFRIRSLSSGLVLDVTGASTADGTLIQQFPGNGGANQQWALEAVAVG